MDRFAKQGGDRVVFGAHNAHLVVEIACSLQDPGLLPVTVKVVDIQGDCLPVRVYFNSQGEIESVFMAYTYVGLEVFKNTIEMIAGPFEEIERSPAQIVYRRKGFKPFLGVDLNALANSAKVASV